MRRSCAAKGQHRQDNDQIAPWLLVHTGHAQCAAVQETTHPRRHDQVACEECLPKVRVEHSWVMQVIYSLRPLMKRSPTRLRRIHVEVASYNDGYICPPCIGDACSKLRENILLGREVALLRSEIAPQAHIKSRWPVNSSRWWWDIGVIDIVDGCRSCELNVASNS